MFGRQKFLVYFIVLALSFLAIYFKNSNSCSDIKEDTVSSNKEYPILIAHAGGHLYGRTYLNSKEAVENSIYNGFHYIELDLLETTDGDLIAAHTWKDFHKLTTGEKSDEQITSEEAKNRKILGKQTVLTSEEINKIFLANKDLILVTDKIQNLDLLEEKFKGFKDRIIVEVFSVEKYKEAQKKGFRHAAFCVWNSEGRYKQVERNKIDMVTLPIAALSERKKWYEEHPEVVPLAFGPRESSANNLKDIEQISQMKGWYTDFITPKMLETK